MLESDGMFVYYYKPKSNNADTIWCVANKKHNNELCNHLIKSMGKLLEDAKKGAFFTTVELDKDCKKYKAKRVKIDHFLKRKTSALSSQGSKHYKTQNTQSPEMVIGGMVTKCARIQDNDENPSENMLKQINAIGDEFQNWFESIVSKEHGHEMYWPDSLTNDTFKMKRYNEAQTIADYIKSITIIPKREKPLYQQAMENPLFGV